MTHEELSKKRTLFILMVAYFLFGYFACSYFNLDRSHYFDVGLPFEAKIPFIPFFIIGYTSVYLGLIFVYAVIDDYLHFKMAMMFFSIVSTVHFILFVLLPVKMVRPEISTSDGVMTMMTYYYYLIDNPVNCFPSLHVSYPFTGMLVLWNYKRHWSYLMAVLTLFIAVSVLLVKQHYFLDVIAGLAITSGLFAIMRPKITA